jgi:hypothetical protein
MTDRSVELDCAEYHVQSASIGHARSAAVFGCTIRTVPDAIVAILDEAARSNESIRLIFPREPLVLERVEVERLEPGCVRIVGRLVAG